MLISLRRLTVALVGIADMKRRHPKKLGFARANPWLVLLYTFFVNTLNKIIICIVRFNCLVNERWQWCWLSDPNGMWEAVARESRSCSHCPGYSTQQTLSFTFLFHTHKQTEHASAEIAVSSYWSITDRFDPFTTLSVSCLFTYLTTCIITRSGLRIWHHWWYHRDNTTVSNQVRTIVYVLCLEKSNISFKKCTFLYTWYGFQILWHGVKSYRSNKRLKHTTINNGSSCLLLVVVLSNFRILNPAM